MKDELDLVKKLYPFLNSLNMETEAWYTVKFYFKKIDHEKYLVDDFYITQEKPSE